MVCALPFCYLKTINERMIRMDKKEFVLDLYEIELHKKTIFSEDIMGTKPKKGKELEYKLSTMRIAILEDTLNCL